MGIGVQVVVEADRALWGRAGGESGGEPLRQNALKIADRGCDHIPFLLLTSTRSQAKRG